jgi:hypothetical protein
MLYDESKPNDYVRSEPSRKKHSHFSSQREESQKAEIEIKLITNF